MGEKRVFITGCSSGIGKALAMTFHQMHCRVIATARQTDSISDLKDLGIAVHQLDVTDYARGRQVIDTVLENEKRIDVLINNAGYALIGPGIELPESELAMQFETNVKAPLMLAKAVAPSMKQNKSGMIVNMGSISGIAATPFSGAYCASKAALHSFSDALRMELEVFGIHVMTVQPGAIQSQFGNTAEKSIARVLESTSWYYPVKKAIQARATASQVNATPTRLFARKLAEEILSDTPKAIVRIGKMSRSLPWMKTILPTTILDKMFKDKFGLGKGTALKIGKK